MYFAFSGVSDFSAALGIYAGIFILIFALITALIVFYTVVAWRFCEKLYRPGWIALIPFYNMYVLFSVAKMKLLYFVTLLLLAASSVFDYMLLSAKEPSLVLLVALIPILLAMVIIYARLSVGVANAFGKGGAFAAGLFFLPVVFYPILAFGKSRYFSKL